MNRGKRIKQMQKILRKRGYIFREIRTTPNKAYRYYRKGGFCVTFIDKATEASITFTANNKYNAYKGILEEVYELDEEKKRKTAFETKDETILCDLFRNEILKYGNITQEGTRAPEEYYPNGSYEAVFDSDMLDYNLSCGDTTKRKVYRNILIDIISEFCKKGLNKTTLDDIDKTIILDYIEDMLTHHSFEETIKSLPNVTDEYQPVVRGFLKTSVPDTLQEISHNFCG